MRWLGKLDIKWLKNLGPAHLVVAIVFFFVGLLFGPIAVVILVSALGGY